MKKGTLLPRVFSSLLSKELDARATDRLLIALHQGPLEFWGNGLNKEPTFIMSWPEGGSLMPGHWLVVSCVSWTIAGSTGKSALCVRDSSFVPPALRSRLISLRTFYARVNLQPELALA